jgi:hypothetical protein
LEEYRRARKGKEEEVGITPGASQEQECKEGEHRNEQGKCVAYEEDPRGCGCNTWDPPEDYQPFAAGLIGDAREDMLCNLKCYNGMYEVGLYRSVARKGTDFVISELPALLPQSSLGLFLSLGTDVGKVIGRSDPDVMDELVLKYGGFGVTSPGGVIVVRPPFFPDTRASLMATLVEEIWHAVHYHSACGIITKAETEFLAKVGQLAWITFSGIPPWAFLNLAFRSGLTRTLGEMGFDQEENREVLAFMAGGGRCPGTEVASAALPVSFRGSVSSLKWWSQCVDPMVFQQLRNVI